MIRVARRVLMVLTTVTCLVITAVNALDCELNTVGTMRVVEEYADTYYEMLSDNVGITTINGISNVYVNMAADGYHIYKEDVGKSYIDVSFVKDGAPSYRYYYEHPEGRITFFCSEYENSFSGLAYIIERKEIEAEQ